MTELLAHSPLGASGSYRWMACPASIRFSEGVEDPESEHAALGTAAHEVGDRCLTGHMDAWEMIGEEVYGRTVDKEMAIAVQTYLDGVRQRHPDRDQSNFFVERRFHCPTIHGLFYGTSDAIFVDQKNRGVSVWDYKHGAGIIVDPHNNPQMMYYACGVLEELDLWDSIDMVSLLICQPRGFHAMGAIREWSISVDALLDWLEFKLLPAMDTASGDATTVVSGEHCRFCPARYTSCPALKRDMERMKELMAKIEGFEGGVEALTNEEVGEFLDLFDLAKTLKKSADDTAFIRLQAGHAVPGRKLAPARVFRKWKDGAEEAAVEKFGDRALTTPAFRSPADVEKLTEGRDFTRRWAFKPDAGLTVVTGSDSRPAVNSETKSMFKPAGKRGSNKEAK
jgi:hypothetical protein